MSDAGCGCWASRPMLLASPMVAIGVAGGLPQSCSTATLCVYRWIAGRWGM